MRVARLIIYDGPDKEVQLQLGSSVAQGIRMVRQSVRMTVVDVPDVLLTLLDEVGERVAAVQANEPVLSFSGPAAVLAGLGLERRATGPVNVDPGVAYEPDPRYQAETQRDTKREA